MGRGGEGVRLLQPLAADRERVEYDLVPCTLCDEPYASLYSGSIISSIRIYIARQDVV